MIGNYIKIVCCWIFCILLTSTCRVPEQRNAVNNNHKSQEIESFKNDLKLFMLSLQMTKGIDTSAFIFPFYGANKYLPNYDVYKPTNYLSDQIIQEADFFKFKNLIITDRDKSQFSNFLIDIDSLSPQYCSYIVPAKQSYISLFFSIEVQQKKNRPNCTCHEIDLNDEEEASFFKTLLMKVDSSGLLIELGFVYSLNGKEGSKHFIFIKNNGRYKLIGVRSFGHI